MVTLTQGDFYVERSSDNLNCHVVIWCAQTISQFILKFEHEEGEMFQVYKCV